MLPRAPVPVQPVSLPVRPTSLRRSKSSPTFVPMRNNGVDSAADASAKADIRMLVAVEFDRYCSSFFFKEESWRENVGGVCERGVGVSLRGFGVPVRVGLVGRCGGC